jgi:metallo-beta-lactamase family protein
LCLGAKIVRGDKEVSIHGTVFEVKAEVKKLESFSGHGDYKEMIGFLSCQDKSALAKTFIVHGEYETQKKYAATLLNEGYKNIEVPAKGQEYEI